YKDISLDNANVDFYDDVKYTDQPINISEFVLIEDKICASQQLVMQKQAALLYEKEYRFVHKDIATNIQY
ncbi:hypothetical protein, partial [Vibrio cyclitrophicus]|uniref:hypothetical protein n=1 Tax=Vibrio cyclitrophicus TaxID=47951 RepID=UPI001A7E0EE2